MSAPDNFCVFIITHGRPNAQKTMHTLARQNYTGPLYLIVDDEDKTLPEYQQRYGDMVRVFNKQTYVDKADNYDNFGAPYRSTTYCRNACFDFAQELGYEYFLVLDDDYREFQCRFGKNFELKFCNPKNLDKLFNAILDYYRETPTITALCLAQNGDMIGGGDNMFLQKVRTKRKAMNTFFCSVHRPFDFVGRLNEDVNTFISLGARGNVFLTIYNANINQDRTQNESGGMTDAYLNAGTYNKSFYTVLTNPSCIKIADMGNVNRRIHHHIQWRNAVPCIISEQYRKVDKD